MLFALKVVPFCQLIQFCKCVSRLARVDVSTGTPDGLEDCTIIIEKLMFELCRRHEPDGRSKSVILLLNDLSVDHQYDCSNQLCLMSALLASPSREDQLSFLLFIYLQNVSEKKSF